jgi:hypothetical protein
MFWEHRRKGMYYYRTHNVRARVIMEYVTFSIALSAAIIIVGRLVREGWRRYQLDDRPLRRP